MSDKLYEYMDWPEIETVVYSEENSPKSILGPRVTEDGILVQCFFPDRNEVSLKTISDGKIYPMEKEDDGGYFAVLIPGKDIPEYVYPVSYTHLTLPTNSLV